MKIKALFFLLSTLCLFDLLHAQNMIFNGDFESVKIKNWFGFKNYIAKKWISQASGELGVFGPLNDVGSYPWSAQFGFKSPRSGNFMTVLGLNSYGYASIIQTELVQSLKKDSLYNLEFWLSRADSSGWPKNKVVVCFSNVPFGVQRLNNSAVTKIEVILDGVASRDSVSWSKVNSIFKANGGERYMWLGALEVQEPFQRSLSDWPDSVFSTHSRTQQFSVYFIDDFSLTHVVSNAQGNLERGGYEWWRSKYSETNLGFHFLAENVNRIFGGYRYSTSMGGRGVCRSLG
jgi:hypothetical protein